MSPPYLLGIDSGLTLTKAVVFDAQGHQLAVGRGEVATLLPQPRWAERDMVAHWDCCARAIREALAGAGIAAHQIAGVGLSGHGDGAYLLDRHQQPLGPAILSLDTRACSELARWRTQGSLLDDALRLTGQIPHAAAPAAVLRWVREHQPERFKQIGAWLTCKDWLRFNLTGDLATDLTEGSQSFCDVRTQTYSSDALALYGLQDLKHALVPMLPPCAVAGRVTPAAAARTGLSPGTPVATGLHDVAAAAVGTGVVSPGMLSLVAGTYSINQVFSDAPRPGTDWHCRNGLKPGQWLHMSLSPASSANIEWFLRQHCRDALETAQRQGISPFDVLKAELDAAFACDSQIIYHPFLYGSPYGHAASASFLGVQAWHQRGHLLRALLEGVVFNHRHHVDALRQGFHFDLARLTGGSARNPRICQLFADALGLPVEVPAVTEAGALGAALCASVAIGLYPDLAAAAHTAVNPAMRHTPQARAQHDTEQRYRLYQQSIEHLTPLWNRLRDPI